MSDQPNYFDDKPEEPTGSRPSVSAPEPNLSRWTLYSLLVVAAVVLLNTFVIWLRILYMGGDAFTWQTSAFFWCDGVIVGLLLVVAGRLVSALERVLR